MSILDAIEALQEIRDSIGGHMPVKLSDGVIECIRMQNNAALIEIGGESKSAILARIKAKLDEAADEIDSLE